MTSQWNLPLGPVISGLMCGSMPGLAPGGGLKGPSGVGACSNTTVAPGTGAPVVENTVPLGSKSQSQNFCHGDFSGFGRREQPPSGLQSQRLPWGSVNFCCSGSGGTGLGGVPHIEDGAESILGGEVLLGAF